MNFDYKMFSVTHLNNFDCYIFISASVTVFSIRTLISSHVLLNPPPFGWIAKGIHIAKIPNFIYRNMFSIMWKSPSQINTTALLCFWSFSLLEPHSLHSSCYICNFILLGLCSLLSFIHKVCSQIPLKKKTDRKKFFSVGPCSTPLPN